jgi:hypothetical protein
MLGIAAKLERRRIIDAHGARPGRRRRDAMKRRLARMPPASRVCARDHHDPVPGELVERTDPVLCPDPAARPVKMAIAMREATGGLITAWRRHGCELGFGAGIAQGYATLGRIGFSERSGYTAIGTVCNLAARLCAEAKDG